MRKEIEEIEDRETYSITSRKDLNHYKGFINNLKSKSYDFVIHTKSSTQKVYVKGEVAMKKPSKYASLTGDLRKQAISLKGQVAIAIKKYITDNNFNVDVVPQRCSSSYTNRKLYGDKMGFYDAFYYIDIKHCYWRIAYLNGYISDNLYNKYANAPELKQWRNMSLSGLVTPIVREYYINGEFAYEIEEDRTLHNKVYQNIRNTAWNLMGDARKIARDSFIAYRTDGIMVKKRGIKRVTKFIEKSGFEYRIVDCHKLDDTMYFYDGEVKNL
jgi:hypothetical protein